MRARSSPRPLWAAARLLLAFAALLIVKGCAIQGAITPNEVLEDHLPRTALVIGNGAYAHVTALDNPTRDAQAIADSLVSAGYALHGGGPYYDLTQAQFEQVLADFAASVNATGGLSFFYFAGHGLQVNGQNYLIPIDAEIADAGQIASKSIDLQALLTLVETDAVKSKVFVIDACRNNPFEEAPEQTTAAAPAPVYDDETVVARRSAAPKLRTISSGLSQLVAPPGALVAFSTAPGGVALDEVEGSQNSPYALALSSAIREPGLRVEDVFIAVRNRTRQMTGGVQTPWETSSLTAVSTFNGALTIGGERREFDQRTALWDGRYLATMECNAVDEQIHAVYHPIIIGGEANEYVGSQWKGENKENYRLFWRVNVDGGLTVTGPTRLGFVDLSGRMSDTESTISGTLGGRRCVMRLRRR